MCGHAVRGLRLLTSLKLRPGMRARGPVTRVIAHATNGDVVNPDEPDGEATRSSVAAVLVTEPGDTGELTGGCRSMTARWWDPSR